MKKYLFLWLCFCGNAQAELDSLPPVIDNSSYPTVAPLPNTTPAPASTALYDMTKRLEQLQTEVQQLTGKVEEQGNQIAELKKHQTTAYSDFDERLQNIEKGTPSSATNQPVPVVETPTEATPVSTETETPVSEVVPTDLPVPPAVPVENETPTEVSPTPPTTVKPTVTKQPEVQASGDEKQAYQKAYNALRNGHTDQSIEQFKAYLSKYPTGGYADVTYYWLGEAYRVKLDNDSARQTLNTVLEKYPSSAKVPDTLLKLGYIEADLKNSAKAREYLTRVTTEFPNTPAAHSAEKKLTQLKN